MRYYLISEAGIRACDRRPKKRGKHDIVVSSAEELAGLRLSDHRLLTILNRVSGKKLAKIADRENAIARLWSAVEAVPSPATNIPAKRRARSNSKQARVIAMLCRPAGTTIEAIAAATGWQRHTVRGLISGTLKKKLGLALVTEKRGNGARIYRIGEKP
jgi:hypothetical protein